MYTPTLESRIRYWAARLIVGRSVMGNHTIRGLLRIRRLVKAQALRPAPVLYEVQKSSRSTLFRAEPVNYVDIGWNAEVIARASGEWTTQPLVDRQLPELREATTKAWEECQEKKP